jgi:ATP-dependent Clp protease ATP-binding subunit ClpC
VLVTRFLGPNSVAADIRAEVARWIPARERISTSVEVPLTDECKKILNLAGEECEGLGHRYVGTEHLLLAMLGAQASLAARLLRDRGATPERIREQMAKTPGSAGRTGPQKPSIRAIAALDSFLTELKWYDWEKLAPFFRS